ncbi:btk-binding protein-related [Anaeramoeba flamelloides]|uniref:Btk-binding protein-related n=1 Tax=Anaeramoeba flamelloides TaxID=1746091 RepID=A0AAV7YJ99_9EUKA|nr:btk-binding protein-related [Anaeramoeba flamelloides]
MENNKIKSDFFLGGLYSPSTFTFHNLILWTWNPIKEIKKPTKVVSGTEPHMLVLTENNTLELYHSKKGKKIFNIENERIMDIISGAHTYLILTSTGKVFSLANGSKYPNHKKVPTKDWTKNTMDKIEPVPYFTKKNLFVKQIAMGYCTNYYLCSNGELYGSGFGSNGRLGLDLLSGSPQLPVLIEKNVESVYSGAHGLTFFYVTSANELFGSGKHTNGILGINVDVIRNIPSKMRAIGFEPREITNLKTGQNHSVLITNKGKIFSCGDRVSNGHGTTNTVFTELAEFKNKFVVEMASGEYQTLALTKDGEFYAWGFKVPPTNESNSWERPTKIKLPNLTSTSPTNIKFWCGSTVNFVFNCNVSALYQDFRIFFNSKKFTDLVLGSSSNETKCHRCLVKLRTNKTEIEKIKELFIQKNEEEINNFLGWVYCDQVSNNQSLRKIFKSLNLSYPPENNLKQDLLKLYKDEDSKDFSILVQDEDEDEDENEDNFEELPVHKFILLVRSGLFREMFGNIDQNSKSVKDFSGKTLESIEILIKYFYTEKIEFTADDDPEFIAEELADAIEYYQLNKNSNLKEELLKTELQN